MNINESEIHLSIYEQGGFKRKLENKNRKESNDNVQENITTRKITLGPAFIANALKDPEPAKKLKVLQENAHIREYHKLTTNMKLHLHVKQYVADVLGVDFGGKLKCFDWKLI